MLRAASPSELKGVRYSSQRVVSWPVARADQDDRYAEAATRHCGCDSLIGSVLVFCSRLSIVTSLVSLFLEFATRGMEPTAELESERFIDEKTDGAAATATATATISPPFPRDDDDDDDDQTAKEWDRVALQRQLLAAMGAIVGSVSFGMTTAFPATLSQNFARGDDAISIDENVESWIAGSVVLWMLVGVIAAGVCMRLRGRRIAQACLYVCWICGWLTASYASDVRSLLAGCALMGLSAGSHAVVSAVYVGEVTEPRFRGIISVQISLGVAAGILAGHAQGVLFAGRTALRGCAVLPAVALSLVLAFARESPSWLAFNGRVQTARSVFLRLRNEAPTSHAELNSLVEAAAARSERNRRFATTSSGWCWCRCWGDLKRQVSSNAFRKSFLVLNVLFVVQQGSGMNVIVFHAITLLKAVSADVDLPSSAIIADTVRFFATLTACVLVKVTGRRKLYLWSASGALLSLCALVVGTLYRVHGVILICWTCAYIVFLYLGVAPIPWIMVGELYPANLKEFGICISCFCCFLTMLIVVKTAIFLLAHLGTTFTFAIYVAIMLIGVVFLFFRMPETNNITLQQIEKNLST